MKFPPIPQIETPRLRLRKLRPDDLETYHRHLTSDPAVARYMLWEATPDISHTAATIERRMAAYATKEPYHWAVARKEDDCLIGTISLLRFDETGGTCSFAYMLGKKFWGQGYGTEVLKAVFAFAFQEMEVTAISADHMTENPASGAAMKKAGMTQTALPPAQYEKNGRKYDAIQYQITRENWTKMRRN